MQIIGGTPLLAFVVEGPRCRAHKGGSDLPCFVVFPCQESCASFTERTSSPSGRPAAGGASEVSLNGRIVLLLSPRVTLPRLWEECAWCCVRDRVQRSGVTGLEVTAAVRSVP